MTLQKCAVGAFSQVGKRSQQPKSKQRVRRPSKQEGYIAINSKQTEADHSQYIFAVLALSDTLQRSVQTQPKKSCMKWR